MSTPENGPVTEPEAKKSRAGRNLGAAAAVGVSMGAIALLSLIFFKDLFVIVIVVAIVIGTDELSKAFGTRHISLARFPLLMAAAILPPLAYYRGPVALLGGVGVAFLLTLMFCLRKGTDNYVANSTASAFVLSYAPLMGGFAALLLRPEKGAQWAIIFIVLTICSDIGGYMAGVLFGKHPMAPKISPKKSWEGFAGSIALQCILGSILFPWLLGEPLWKGIIMAVIMTITATLGDFIESAIKRDLGLKDMGTLLPGHGGLMDRLDSLIPNTVVAWVLLSLLAGAS